MARGIAMAERAVEPQDECIVGWKAIACFLFVVPRDIEVTEAMVARAKKTIYRRGIRFASLPDGNVYVYRDVLEAIRRLVVGTR